MLIKIIYSRVTDSDQLKEIRGIGDSIREKIQEILRTGTLKKLESYQNNTTINLKKMFSKIWGVGPITAHQLVLKGYKLVLLFLYFTLLSFINFFLLPY